MTGYISPRQARMPHRPWIRAFLRPDLYAPLEAAGVNLSARKSVSGPSYHRITRFEWHAHGPGLGKDGLWGSGDLNVFVERVLLEVDRGVR